MTKRQQSAANNNNNPMWQCRNGDADANVAWPEEYGHNLPGPGLDQVAVLHRHHL